MTGDAHEQFLGHFQDTAVYSNWREKSCEIFFSSNSQMLFLFSFGGNITVFPFVFWCSSLFILLSYNLFCLGCRPLPSTLGQFPAVLWRRLHQTRLSYIHSLPQIRNSHFSQEPRFLLICMCYCLGFSLFPLFSFGPEQWVF